MKKNASAVLHAGQLCKSSRRPTGESLRVVGKKVNSFADNVRARVHVCEKAEATFTLRLVEFTLMTV